MCLLLQTADEVQAGVMEANLFSLVSHQYWGVWALIQARHSPIDFDYLGYSKLRWAEYDRRVEFYTAANTFTESQATSTASDTHSR